MREKIGYFLFYGSAWYLLNYILIELITIFSPLCAETISVIAAINVMIIGLILVVEGIL